MTTTWTVVASVTYKDKTYKVRTWTWKGRKAAPALARIRANYKAEGAVSVAFGKAISVYSYGAH